MSHRDTLMEAARRIGTRLVRTALHDGDVCTWRVTTPDYVNGRTRAAIQVAAPGSLYQGTAGIGLFLAQLASISTDAGHRRAGLGAVRHALAWAEALPGSAWGFHSGALGPAYAAHQAGHLLGVTELQERACDLLRRYEGHEAEDDQIDVIGGAAGAIPALLALDWSGIPTYRITAIAGRLGENLLRAANFEPSGWSWGSRAPAHVRNLTGLAHGAAGVGLAFHELAAATGEDRWRYAADQACAYENSHFDNAAGNWLDLRRQEITEYILEGRLNELRTKAVSSESIGTYKRRCMVAWCHGAPGIGLARLRAHRLTGNPDLLADAVRAIATTTDNLRRSWRSQSFSLCHGVAGNCDLLLYASVVLDRPELEEFALSIAMDATTSYEFAHGSWPTGVIGGAPDPGLLLGEAGIGYHMLRLVDRRIPSVLLHEPEGPRRTAGPPSQTAAQLRDQYAESFFTHSRHAIRAFVPAVRKPAVCDAPAEEAGQSAAQLARDLLEAAIQNESDALRPLLADLFMIEATAYDVAAAATDWTEDFIQMLALPAAEDLGRCSFALHRSVRIVRSSWDWSPWFRGDPRELPARGDRTWLIHCLRGSTRVLCIRPFAALVLESIHSEPDVATLITTIAGSIDWPVSTADLTAKVLEQIGTAVASGIVIAKCTRPSSAATSSMPGERAICTTNKGVTWGSSNST